MLGHNSFDFALTPTNRVFSVETEVIPSLEELYGVDSEYFSEFNFHYGTVSFPDATTIKLDSVDGSKSDSHGNWGAFRLIVKPGYIAHTTTGFAIMDGDSGTNGTGQVVYDSDVVGSHRRKVPMEYKITKIVRKSDGVELIPTVASGGGGSGGGTDGNGDSDCASENRVVNTDNSCGDCITGYTEDTAGTCVADVAEEEEKTNWLLWGGIAAVVAFVLMG